MDLPGKGITHTFPVTLLPPTWLWSKSIKGMIRSQTPAHWGLNPSNQGSRLAIQQPFPLDESTTDRNVRPNNAVQGNNQRKSVFVCVHVRVCMCEGLF